MLEPVLKRSPNRTKPNSLEPNRIRSSASRDRCTAVRESVKSSSATKSRSATASMLFGVIAEKPRLPCSSTREIGKAQPATAPAPSGQDGGGAGRLGEAGAVALERPEMRQHPVRRGDRLGALQVRVGGDDGVLEPRWRGRASCAGARGRRRPGVRRRPSSRAGWPSPPGRCRLRPVCSREATAPTSSCRRRSIMVCTSSSVACGSAPSANRSATRASPRSSAWLSSSESTPPCQRATAHAWERRMSNGQRR